MGHDTQANQFDRLLLSSMLAEIKIPLCSFETTFVYEVPKIQFIAERAPLIEEIFKAFSPWTPSFDDIQFLNEGKNSDRGVNFKIASQNASFFVGPTHCRFTKEGANWAEVDLIGSIMQAGLSALRRVSEIPIRSQHVVVSMHIQPTTVPFRNILREAIIAERVLALDSEQPTVMAIVVKWLRYRVTIDSSVALANAIYVQMEREFEGQATFDDVKTAVRTDQSALFDLLNIEEEVPA